MKPTNPIGAPKVSSDLSWARSKFASSLLARAEKAEQERDEALEKARDRESARVIETDRADGISETLQEARRHIDELEEKYTDTRLAVARLRSAQRPRPMDEAPKDGTEILGMTSSTGCQRIYFVMWWLVTADGWIGHHRDYWCPDGWLPLPDQDEETTS